MFTCGVRNLCIQETALFSDNFRLCFCKSIVVYPCVEVLVLNCVLLDYVAYNYIYSSSMLTEGFVNYADFKINQSILSILTP